MRIQRVELARLRVPLRTPFRTALRTVDATDDVIVLLHDEDGRIGYGAAPPATAITGETHASIVAAITGAIAPRLYGARFDALQDATARVGLALPGNSSAKAAVDIALHDLWSRNHRLPLYRLLGGDAGPHRLLTDLTISVNDVDTMVADACAAVAAGYAALKLKVGLDDGLDVDRVREIHAAVGNRAALRIDANQGWTPRQAVEVIGALEAAGVPMDLVEQPVPAADLDGLKFVTDRVATPVLADESVFGLDDARRVIEGRAADLINIKLMKTGGLGHALAIVDLAAAHGIGCMVGCMLEGSVSVGAAAHMAAARPGAIARIDLDGPALCVADPVTGGTRFDGPRIDLNDTPGLGITAITGLVPISTG